MAYGSLLQGQRRVLHARIVEVLETHGDDQLTEQVERLAHHALRGEVWDRAVVYLRQAGSKASARSAYHEAASCFEQALKALEHVPEGRETLEQAIDLRFDLRREFLALRASDQILDLLRTTERLAVDLGDPRRQGRVLLYLRIWSRITSRIA